MHTVSKNAQDIRVWQRHGEYTVYATLLEAILSFYHGAFNWSRVGVKYDAYRPCGRFRGLVDCPQYEDLIYEVQYIVEIDGKPVPVERLQDEISTWNKANWEKIFPPKSHRHVFRRGNVENIGRSRNWNGIRRPATVQERALWFAKDDEPGAAVRVKGRAARSPRNLPTSYSDIDRHTEHNWKSQRRTQWKIRNKT